MTENQINDRAAAQKRAALLALAAKTQATAGECLTPDAMAAFLDNACLPEEKARVLNHISLCRRCYGEWLILAELQLERGRKHREKPQRPFFLRPINLAAIGSAMAAMVCIGIFFNIDPFSYRTGKEQALPSVSLEKESAPAPLLRQKPADKADHTTPSQPLEQLLPPQNRSKDENRGDTEKALEKGSPELNSSTPEAASQSTTVSQPAAAPPAPAASEQKAQSATPSAMRKQGAAQPQASASLSFQQWQNELITLCRQQDLPSINQEDLRRLFLAGKKSLSVWQRESEASSADRYRTGQILQILSQVRNSDQLLENCQKILATDPEGSE